MVGKCIRGAVLAVAVTVTALPALADAVKQSAVDLLFETKHLELVGKGAEVAYRIQRTVSDTKMLGEPFSDDIKVGVNAVDAAGKREVVIKMFSGDRARDPRVETDMTGNPILVFFLDRSVMNFALVGGGNRNYLKQQFRDALRDKADVQKVKIEYGGKSVDGYRIVVTPYANDKNATRMLGYEGARFSFVVSDAVPGYFVDLLSTFDNAAKEAPRFEERITLVGAGAVQ
jgi:hypothetical protein